MSGQPEVSTLLTQITRDDRRAVNQLMPLVYDQLRQIAAGYLGPRQANITLQPTALVHEAYLRLVDQSRVDWQGETHFRAVAATMMYRVLCDHVKARRRQKRGGDRERVTLTESAGVSDQTDMDLSALLKALEKLTAQDQRQFDIVVYRCLGGLTTAQTALVMDTSERTIEREWSFAKAFLKRELSASAEIEA